MLFEGSSRAKRLNHVLSKYQRKAQSDRIQLLSLIPATELWRFFIDGIRQKAPRGILAELKQLHGDDVATSKKFLSLKLRQYQRLYEKKRGLYFTQGHKTNVSLKELLADSFMSLERIKPILDKLTLADIVNLDQAWVAFELNEPHYHLAILRAFLPSVTLSGKIDVDYIQTLHELIGQVVRGTNYDLGGWAMENPDKPGKFRRTPYAAFGLVAGSNVSRDGLVELLRQKNPSFLLIFTIHDVSTQEVAKFIISQKTIAGFRDEIPVISEYIRFKRSGRQAEKLDPDHNALDAICCDIASEIKKITTNNELGTFLYSLIENKSPLANPDIVFSTNYAYEMSHENTRVRYGHLLAQLIDDYYHHMESAETPLSKLVNIVTFVRSCEQLHPFDDMNCRLFCMVILNNLLAINGFPYVIQDDPLRFGMFSIKELVDDMIRGMERTFELIAKKSVCDVDTSAVLESLRSSENTRPFYDDFKFDMRMIKRLRDNLLLHPTLQPCPHVNLDEIEAKLVIRYL